MKIYFCSCYAFSILMVGLTITTLISIKFTNSDNNTVLAFFYLSRENNDNNANDNDNVDSELNRPAVVDKSAPVIKITDPSPQSTLPYSTVLVNGTVYDDENGIQIVEAFAHKYPFNDVFEFKKTDIIPDNNMQFNDNGADGASRWSISLPVDSPGIYRVLVHAKDSAENENWTETRFNVPFILDSSSSSSSIKKIAVVVPTFTEAAYTPNAFYTFYNKYHSTPPGQNVTKDLDWLTAHLLFTFIGPYTNANIENFSMVNHPPDPDDVSILTLAEHLRKTRPDSLVSIIRDEDIHNGYIFDPRGIVADAAASNDANKNGKNNNIYDTLILFHDEYASQEMYDNYRRFVNNGGTIVFLDANVFIAEVDYNKENRTISLVKGHEWEFINGTLARKSVLERWFKENKEWIGSNFLVSDITGNITFANNPFNYTHFEENYVNNPHVKILIDYGAVLPKNSVYAGFTVASYLLEYGKGNIVMIGLYGQHLILNQQFLKFIDQLLSDLLV
jgi:hypothetical protein